MNEENMISGSSNGDFNNFANNFSSSGQSDSKVLAKTMFNNEGTKENVDTSIPEVSNEPFVAPVIDFFGDMPAVDETFIKPIAMPIKNEAEVQTGYSVDIPQNDFVPPVFDMPSFVVKEEVVNDNIPLNDFNINELPNNSVSDIVLPEENFSAFNFEANKDEPLDTPQPVEVPSMNQDDILNNFSNVFSVEPVEEVKLPEFSNIEPIVSNDFNNIEPVVNSDFNNTPVSVKVADEVVHENINTMSANEIVNNFNGYINNSSTVDSNSLNVEPYKEVSDNTFSSIFGNVPVSDQTFFTSSDKESLPEGRVELVAPIKKEVKQKRRIIPKGYGLGVFIFVMMFVFVMNIDIISKYIQDLGL